MSSADKRRRARIQGGCNVPNLNAAKHAQVAECRRQNEFTAGGGFDATVLGTACDPSSEANRAAFGTKSTFHFEETNQPMPRQKPEVRDIMKEGLVTLSHEPSGPSTIVFYPRFLDRDLADDLYVRILHNTKWEDKYIKRRGEEFLMPRKVAWYGPLPYTYSGATMQPENDWPPYIVAVHDQLKQLLDTEFNSVLLNLYLDEHNSVGWHSDDELSMGIKPKIASVSLGGTRLFEMRKKPPPEENGCYDYMPHARVQLVHGSLLVMDGHTQEDWQHRIPKEPNTRQTRINLTFRNVFEEKPSTLPSTKPSTTAE